MLHHFRIEGIAASILKAPVSGLLLLLSVLAPNFYRYLFFGNGIERLLSSLLMLTVYTASTALTVLICFIAAAAAQRLKSALRKRDHKESNSHEDK